MRPHSTMVTATVFHILLALATKERHGYEIIKQVEADTNGAISLLTGTLYGAIKRLIEDGLIEELPERPIAEDSLDERRRYYRLTEKGLQVLGVELARYQSVMNVATKHGLLNPLSYV